MLNNQEIKYSLINFITPYYSNKTQQYKKKTLGYRILLSQPSKLIQINLIYLKELMFQFSCLD